MAFTGFNFILANVILRDLTHIIMIRYQGIYFSAVTIG